MGKSSGINAGKSKTPKIKAQAAILTDDIFIVKIDLRLATGLSRSRIFWA
ncbi:MAG: hypothetical protein IJS81_09590 [Selenomonadaceae bacterium]|nr:hypothetical protein [Selenomonadaceae bacterium]